MKPFFSPVGVRVYIYQQRDAVLSLGVFNLISMKLERKKHTRTRRNREKIKLTILLAPRNPPDRHGKRQ